MTKAAQFWDKIAQKYAAKPVPDEQIYQRKLALTQSLFKPEMRVLEVGCGTGTTALKHAPFVSQIVATDFSASMIDIAKQKAAEQGVSNVHFACRDIVEVDPHQEDFDVIMAHSVLHLVGNRNEALRALYKQLKPGGYLVSSTACITGPFKLMKPIWPLMSWLGIFPMLYFFSEEALLHSHREVGFEIKQQWTPSKNNFFLIARKPQ